MKWLTKSHGCDVSRLGTAHSSAFKAKVLSLHCDYGICRWSSWLSLEVVCTPCILADCCIVDKN